MMKEYGRGRLREAREVTIRGTVVHSGKSLSAPEYRLLVNLQWYAAGRAVAKVPRRELAADMGMSRDGVQKLLRSLAGKGWVRFRKGHPVFIFAGGAGKAE